MSRFARMFVLAALGALAGFGARAQTLLMNAILPAQSEFNVVVYHPWGEDVERATQGRVHITFTPNTVGSPVQQWDLVRKGIVDGAWFFNPVIPNQLPLEQLAVLPLTSTGAKATSVAQWRTYKKYFEPAGEYNDVQLLALFGFVPSQIFSMKQPLTSAADFKSIKMWAAPGIPSLVAAALGSAVVSTPAATMTQLISGGTVDGFMGLPPHDAVLLKVSSYAKSETMLPGGVSGTSFSVIVNKNSWKSIAPADQAIIMELSGEAFARRLALMDDFNAKALADMVAAGVSMIAASPPFVSEVKAIADKLEAQWIADANARKVDGQAAFDYYVSQLQAEK